MDVFYPITSTNQKPKTGNWQNIDYWSKNGEPHIWLFRADINLATVGTKCYPAIDIGYGNIGIVEETNEGELVVLHKSKHYTLEFGDWLIYTPAPVDKVYAYRKVFSIVE